MSKASPLSRGSMMGLHPTHPSASRSQGSQWNTAFSLVPSGHSPYSPSTLRQHYGWTQVPRVFPNGINPFGHASHTQALLLSLGQVGIPSLPQRPPLWPVDLDPHRAPFSFCLGGSLSRLCGSAQQGMGGSPWSGVVSPQDRLLLLSMTKPELMLLLSSDLPGGLTSIPVTILHPPPSSGQARTLRLSGVPTFVGS